MSEIIKWLNDEALRFFNNASLETTNRRKKHLKYRAKQLRKAADEIERLRAALYGIQTMSFSVGGTPYHPGEFAVTLQMMAKEALKGGEDE